jgi:hypothetical protein
MGTGVGVWREELLNPSPAHAAKHEVTAKKNNQREKRFVIGAIIKVSPSGVKQSRDFYASATPWSLRPRKQTQGAAPYEVTANSN